MNVEVASSIFSFLTVVTKQRYASSCIERVATFYVCSVVEFVATIGRAKTGRVSYLFGKKSAIWKE